MEESSQLHVPVTLCLGESPQYTLNMKFGGLQSWFGHFGVEHSLGFARNQSVIPWHTACGIVWYAD
jgi:hypothetical protein